MDIDNIDNVFRFAYHVGISFEQNLPLLVSKHLNYKNGILYIKPEAISYFEEWFHIRKQLYTYLLENKGEFVAKALLERALIECFKDELIDEYDWILTDYEMIELIAKKGNVIAQKNIQKLMLMDFPQYNVIFYSKDYQLIDDLLAKEKINLIDYAFSKGVLLHFIRDVNKTCRQLHIKTNEQNSEKKTIGVLNDRYLIGFFSDNQNKIKVIKCYLQEELKINLKELHKERENVEQTSIFES